MVRIMDMSRLAVALLAAMILSYLVLRSPSDLTKVSFDGGSVTVPASLEGWEVKPGTGDQLAQGKTRFGTLELEITRTHIGLRGDIKAYVRRQHEKAFRERADYQVRLQGEERYWGARIFAPVGRAAYTGRFMGIQTQYIQHDVYLPYKGEYARVALKYPAFLYKLISLDEAILMTGIELTP